MTDKADSNELAAFVSSTLKAIAEGIADAQSNQIESAHGTGVSGYAAPKEVEFDVAVSAKRTGTSQGCMKVAVFGIGANIGAEDASEDSSISRIRFSVPTNFKRTAPLRTDIPSSKTAWSE